MRVSCMLRQAQDPPAPQNAAHFSQELRVVMSPMTDPRGGKLTSGERTPDIHKLEKVLDAAVDAAKQWETKERKAFLEYLRYWLKLAREHADRIYAAAYKGGASHGEAGDAKRVRDAIDTCRYQITKLPSIRARGPRAKSPYADAPAKVKKELLSTERGVRRLIEMLPAFPALLTNFQRFHQSTDDKKIRTWMKEAWDLFEETQKAIKDIPSEKERARAEENMKKIRTVRHYNFGPGDATHVMEFGKPAVIEKELHVVIALLKEIDSILHGQQLLFASVSNRLRRSMQLRKAGRVVDEKDIVDAVMLLIHNDSKLYQALSSGKMKPAEAAKEGRMQYLSFATQNLREDVRKAQPMIEKEVKDWVAEMKAGKA